MAWGEGLRSTSGQIDFKPSDQTSGMRLNQIGLGIATLGPSDNLHVNGNAIIGDALSVGTSTLTPGTLTAENLTVNNLLKFSVLSEHPSQASEGSVYMNTDGQIYTYINGAWSPLISKPVRYNRGMVKLNTNWVTVTLDQNYQSMVVIATPTNAFLKTPVTTRIKNANGNSFEIKLQRMDGSVAALSDDRRVYYFAIEEGVYTPEEHGLKMEVVTYSSNVTDYKGSWIGERRAYQQTYENPVVLGQVMTANDVNFSIFWSKGSAISMAAAPTLLYTGKHVGSDPVTGRADETIGYIVIEAGRQRHRNLTVSANVGPVTIGGADYPSSSYSLSGPSFTRSAIVSMATMNGDDGGVPFFREFESAAAISANQLLLSVDEDTLVDAERDHAPEIIAYMVFEDTPIKMERGVVTVSSDYSTITTIHHYKNPIVLATLVNTQTEPLCTRIRAISGNSFELRAQQMSPSSNLITGANVHYMVIEAGVYDYATYGVQMEARRHAGITVNNSSNWAGTITTYSQTYSSPVVLGNIQTESNVGFSVFWSRSAQTLGDAPSAANILVGLSKLQDTTARANTETAGYLIIEDDHNTMDGIQFIASKGANNVPGFDNATATYNIGKTIQVAIATMTGIDGTDGGTAIFKNINPAGTTSLKLVVDEDQFVDSERSHASEQIAYLIFY